MTHAQHQELVSWLEGRKIVKVRSGPDGLEFVLDSTAPAGTLSIGGIFRVSHFGNVDSVLPTGVAEFGALLDEEKA